MDITFLCSDDFSLTTLILVLSERFFASNACTAFEHHQLPSELHKAHNYRHGVPYSRSAVAHPAQPHSRGDADHQAVEALRRPQTARRGQFRQGAQDPEAQRQEGKWDVCLPATSLTSRLRRSSP